MRIGLIADTHMPGSIKTLWPEVFHLFEGVCGILHAGDLHTLEVVDQLSDIAPTWVARGNGDRGLEDERLQDSWLLDFGGLSVGMVHHFPTLENKPPEFLSEKMEKLFPHAPDLLVYGHTHRESIDQLNDTMLVNPGSPTLPRNQSLRPGTVGLLEISDNDVVVNIYQLSSAGLAGVAVSMSSRLSKSAIL
ncbi:MAG: YfcE family phosphodiesterase [Gammaproteobacteria bacterium]|nr:YfcE family phosphodiesterase [Gammaproteobacteria bacterium]